MDGEEVEDWVFEKLFTAGMNIDYFQSMAAFWEVANFILVALAVLFAALGVWFGKNSRLSKHSFFWSLLSLAFVPICMVLPAGSAASADIRFKERWNEVRREIESLKQDITSKSLTPADVSERKKAIEQRISSIQEDETRPFRWELDRCWGRQAERFYGQGIDTFAEVQKERARIDAGEQPTPENYPADIEAESWWPWVALLVAIAGVIGFVVVLLARSGRKSEGDAMTNPSNTDEPTTD